MHSAQIQSSPREEEESELIEAAVKDGGDVASGAVGEGCGSVDDEVCSVGRGDTGEPATAGSPSSFLSMPPPTLDTSPLATTSVSADVSALAADSCSFDSSTIGCGSVPAESCMSTKHAGLAGGGEDGSASSGSAFCSLSSTLA